MKTTDLIKISFKNIIKRPKSTLKIFVAFLVMTLLVTSFISLYLSYNNKLSKLEKEEITDVRFNINVQHINILNDDIEKIEGIKNYCYTEAVEMTNVYTIYFIKENSSYSNHNIIADKNIRLVENEVIVGDNWESEINTYITIFNQEFLIKDKIPIRGDKKLFMSENYKSKLNNDLSFSKSIRIDFNCEYKDFYNVYYDINKYLPNETINYDFIVKYKSEKIITFIKNQRLIMTTLMIIFGSLIFIIIIMYIVLLLRFNLRKKGFYYGMLLANGCSKRKIKLLQTLELFMLYVFSLIFSIIMSIFMMELLEKALYNITNIKFELYFKDYLEITILSAVFGSIVTYIISKISLKYVLRKNIISILRN